MLVSCCILRVGCIIVASCCILLLYLTVALRNDVEKDQMKIGHTWPDYGRLLLPEKPRIADVSTASTVAEAFCSSSSHIVTTTRLSSSDCHCCSGFGTSPLGERLMSVVDVEMYSKIS